MSIPFCFRGVLRAAQVEYQVRRSRFIASVTYAGSEEEASDFIDGVAAEHGTASHNVYAYRAGLGVPVERYSDAGEPSGTAGPPALEVLKQRGLLNVAVVITRYFGGIKLGGGGLVRAYSHACALGIDAAHEVNWVAYRHVHAALDYASQGRIEYRLREAGCPIVDITYGSNVTIEFRARHDAVVDWQSELLELTSGNAELALGSWVYLPEDGGGALIPGAKPATEEGGLLPS